MYSHILIPVALDHEPKVPTPLEIAKLLLSEGGKITALYVVEAIPEYISQYLPAGQLEKTMAEAEVQLRNDIGDDPNVQCQVVVGNPGNSILEYASHHACDCIVMQSHCPSIAGLLLGSTAARVVRHAKCCVHVQR